MPVNDDVGYYLRATVTYKDGESAAEVEENDKTAEAVSTHTGAKEAVRKHGPRVPGRRGRGDTHTA